MRRILLLTMLAALIVGAAAVPASAAESGATPRIAVVRSPISDGTVTSAGVRIGGQFLRADAVASWLTVEFGAENVVVIGDAELADANALSAFDVVVLTRQITMTTAQRFAVRQYVAAGGGLVAMFGTARWDYVAGRRPAYIPNITLYPHLAWEWGEMSELYGVSFFNDPLTASGYHIVGAPPASHPILQGVADDLGRSAAIDMNPSRNDYNEYVRILPGAAVTPLLYYSGASANGTPWNGSGWLAGWSSQYENGRAVVFGFQLYDAGGAMFAPPVDRGSSAGAPAQLGQVGRQRRDLHAHWARSEARPVGSQHEDVGEGIAVGHVCHSNPAPRAVRSDHLRPIGQGPLSPHERRVEDGLHRSEGVRAELDSATRQNEAR
jgi:hypothetical protein